MVRRRAIISPSPCISLPSTVRARRPGQFVTHQLQDSCRILRGAWQRRRRTRPLRAWADRNPRRPHGLRPLYEERRARPARNWRGPAIFAAIVARRWRWWGCIGSSPITGYEQTSTSTPTWRLLTGAHRRGRAGADDRPQPRQRDEIERLEQQLEFFDRAWEIKEAGTVSFLEAQGDVIVRRDCGRIAYADAPSAPRRPYARRKPSAAIFGLPVLERGARSRSAPAARGCTTRGSHQPRVRAGSRGARR